MRQRVEAIRQSSEKQALGVLSADEMAAWKAAIGAPFVFREDAAQQPGATGRGWYGGQGNGPGGGWGGGWRRGRGGRGGGGGGAGPSGGERAEPRPPSV